MRRSRKCKISLLSGLGTRVPFLDSHQEYLHPALPSNGSLPMVMSWPPDDMSKIILIPVHEHLGTSLAGALDRGVERNYFADMGCSRGERPACGRAQLLAKRGSIGQMQISAELVPIPDASGCVGMRPGCVPDASRMRRDFELWQISV